MIDAEASRTLAEMRTIVRGLRDEEPLEFAPLPGIADVHGACDEDCIATMVAIADSRFQHALLSTASLSGKLYEDLAKFRLSGRNTPERLSAALAPLRRDGSLPDYPLGSDFTPVEQRLVKALTWLKANTATRAAKLVTIARALSGPRATSPEDLEAVARMGYAQPSGLGETLYAKLVALALRETGTR